MPNSHPLIGFYGGMANNTYSVAKRMQELGANVLYIRDRLDNYAMSQPLWEDLDFTLPYDTLNAQWSPEKWDELADQMNWEPPSWLVDPISIEEETEPNRSYARRWDRSIRNYGPGPSDHYKKILTLMRKCDLLFVCNVHAIILALMSGRPYVICPAGGELMVASGEIKASGGVGQTLKIQARLLRIAFRRARAVVTNTPKLKHASLTGGVVKLLYHFRGVHFERTSMPYSTVKFDESTKREHFNAVLKRLGEKPITAKTLVFIPSRIDYQWKGQDRLIEAISLLRDPNEFAFIFSGWGADYERFKHDVASIDQITILKVALSKPLLYECLGGADLVIDQFVLGHIGTSAREAVSVGTPVMAWLEEERLKAGERPDAPVINARSPLEIATCLNQISSGEINMADVGQRGIDWIQKYSSPTGMLTSINAHLEASAKNQ